MVPYLPQDSILGNVLVRSNQASVSGALFSTGDVIDVVVQLVVAQGVLGHCDLLLSWGGGCSCGQDGENDLKRQVLKRYSRRDLRL